MRSCHGLSARCRSLMFLAMGVALLSTAPSVAADSPGLHWIDVGDSMRALIEADWAERDSRFSTAKPTATAAAKQTPQGVTTVQDAAGGCDGIKNGRWGFHTASKASEPWWQVDLGAEIKLDRVVIFNRTDSNCAPRTAKIRVLVSCDTDCRQFDEVYQHNGQAFYGVKENKPLVVQLADKNVSARVVRLHMPGNCSFALDEVEVYAASDPTKNIALNRPADQKSVSAYSYPGTLPDGVQTAVPPSPKPVGGGFSLAHTRDVVDRGGKLAERLAREGADTRELAPLTKALAELEGRLSALAGKPDLTLDARRAIHFEARWLARRIAFCNPLLDMDKLLFLKRHDSVGIIHMCDQFYGCNAKPGGGLFVLADPFGAEPKLCNLLENSLVERGRLTGRKLDEGAFLSPDLSFDGRTIMFAYTQCKATATYQWGPEISHQIFRVQADGTALEQLTDGDPDDFDPCFLPNGRVAFVSERRGGYLRCGRHCPVYTIFSMNPDGSDVVCLSFHETHEWQPSVNNDGMLVYTRWDYVDRDTNIAHHLWLSYPDGRDPRSYHGNYPERRESRPWMEMDIRAIPGSHKYVAVTGAHHGHAFGSLVLIDQRLEDDGACSQITRLTPEVPFAESEGRPIPSHMVYGTPWPLSEKDYLCVYDPNVKNRGIYWVDSDGNRELIYRDPSISCLSPIPLRPRPMPPVIPDATTQTLAAREAAGGDRQATISVVNVYDSDFQWPEGTKITDLRIIQVLPKSTAPPNQPRIGVANQTNARAVLGTVPVEADGSAHFEAPVGKALYFQALDSQGLAVQSMRSATYVHPGEQLTCQGCHEPKRRQTPSRTSMPMAMQRGPSKILPEVDGTNPFNYVRLVQPVLDRHCVGCHQEKKAVDLSGRIDGNFTRSYNALAAKYGFYFHVTNGSINTGVHGGSRTIPGQFGARASKLLEYLDERHHDVKLPAEDYHRLVLWLDSNSEFLGAYEDAPAQARGEIVKPSLE